LEEKLSIVTLIRHVIAKAALALVPNLYQGAEAQTCKGSGAVASKRAILKAASGNILYLSGAGSLGK